jgi:nucleotide-binding universal stress UspA family protein
VCVLQADSAGQGLVAWAASAEIDILIVGVRETKGLIANALANSTTDYIVHHASCACLLIHPKVRAATPDSCLRLGTNDD